MKKSLVFVAAALGLALTLTGCSKYEEVCCEPPVFEETSFYTVDTPDGTSIEPIDTNGQYLSAEQINVFDPPARGLIIVSEAGDLLAVEQAVSDMLATYNENVAPGAELEVVGSEYRDNQPNATGEAYAVRIMGTDEAGLIIAIPQGDKIATMLLVTPDRSEAASDQIFNMINSFALNPTV